MITLFEKIYNMVTSKPLHINEIFFTYLFCFVTCSTSGPPIWPGSTFFKRNGSLLQGRSQILLSPPLCIFPINCFNNRRLSEKELKLFFLCQSLYIINYMNAIHLSQKVIYTAKVGSPPSEHVYWFCFLLFIAKSTEFMQDIMF